MQPDFRILVLISGSGSNLQTIIDACLSKQIPAQVCAVISNKAGVMGLTRAEKAGVPTQVIPHQNYPTREAFDAALAEAIDAYQPDLVVLAGFMRILTPTFVERYLGRLINIHPSLLPLYPGLNTHQRALDAGDTRHGASVHYVIPELDAGPVLLQGSLKINPEDDAQTLASQVLTQVEHKIYPLAVEMIAKGRVAYKQGQVFLDEEPLPAQGYRIDY